MCCDGTICQLVQHPPLNHQSLFRGGRRKSLLFGSRYSDSGTLVPCCIRLDIGSDELPAPNKLRPFSLGSRMPSSLPPIDDDHAWESGARCTGSARSLLRRRKR